MADTTRGSIIDAHVHVWSPDTHKYPHAPGFDDERPSFTPEDHFQYSRRLGVGRLNLVQMPLYGLDHSYILDLIAGDPETFVGTGIVPALTDVRLPSPDRTMVALSRRGIYAFRVRGGKNARMPLGDWPKWLDHPGYEKMFAAGEEHNLALSFMLSPDDIPEVDRMCARYPETPVIIDHIGGIRKKDGVFPEEQVGLLCRLARHRRVMVKLGPFHAMGEREQRFLDLLPLVRRVVDAFGPERCMWENDTGRPVAAMRDPPAEFQSYDLAYSNLEAGIGLIRDHADFLSGPDKDQILFKTAEDFFFLR